MQTRRILAITAVVVFIVFLAFMLVLVYGGTSFGRLEFGPILNQ